MSNLLLIDGLVLIKVWALGFFVFHFSGIIHILPAIAFFAFFLRFFYKRSLVPNIY
ncbi:MAG: hypothetical protein ABR927_13220 [Bacteroidales bacterium]